MKKTLKKVLSDDDFRRKNVVRRLKKIGGSAITTTKSTEKKGAKRLLTHHPAFHNPLDRHRQQIATLPIQLAFGSFKDLHHLVELYLEQRNLES